MWFIFYFKLFLEPSHVVANNDKIIYWRLGCFCIPGTFLRVLYVSSFLRVLYISSLNFYCTVWRKYCRNPILYIRQWKPWDFCNLSRVPWLVKNATGLYHQLSRVRACAVLPNATLSCREDCSKCCRQQSSYLSAIFLWLKISSISASRTNCHINITMSMVAPGPSTLWDQGPCNRKTHGSITYDLWGHFTKLIWWKRLETHLPDWPCSIPHSTLGTLYFRKLDILGPEGRQLW